MNTSQVVPFYFQSNEIRTIAVDGQPWFVAKDVCDVLGLENVTKALQRIPEQHLALNRIQGKRGEYEVNTVSEPGLYRLILRSDKPQAEPFMEWVTAEVLPSIRKTGGYNLPENEKKVFVRHTHMRGSMAPQGLDIRYTMDLTKIVMRPTSTAIELLERLTGIELADILPEPEAATGELINLFAKQYLIVVPDAEGRVSLSDVYARFKEWYIEQVDDRKRVPPGIRGLAAALRQMGLTVMARGGLTWVFGVRLAQEVQI